jgi:predicted nuclease of predicted toxin-antitoxin system
MKLLFDQNLSFKLGVQLADLFPESNHVRLLGFTESDDRTIWQYARTNGFTMVTQDADFAEMALLYGAPPKVIWLRCGNESTAVIEKILRGHVDAILAFEQDGAAACWEIYG